MSSLKKVSNLYNIDFISRLRTFQRLLGTPYEYVEKFIPKKGNIVDLGCGWGVFANLLALNSEKRNVLGIDLDKDKIERALKTIEGRKNIRFEFKDLKNLNLRKVDVIVIWDVLHHLDESVQFNVLAECSRKLKAGGKLIIKENDTVPFYKLMISHFVKIIALGFNITLSKKIIFRSKEEWKKIIEKYNFDVEHMEHIKTWYGFIVPHSLFVCIKK